MPKILKFTQSYCSVLTLLDKAKEGGRDKGVSAKLLTCANFDRSFSYSRFPLGHLLRYGFKVISGSSKGNEEQANKKKIPKEYITEEKKKEPQELKNKMSR